MKAIVIEGFIPKEPLILKEIERLPLIEAEKALDDLKNGKVLSKVALSIVDDKI